MEKTASINCAIHVHTSVEKVWETMYVRFGDIVLYNPNLQGSHFTKGDRGEQGCERECRLDNRTFIREVITDVTERESFTLEVHDGNMPLVDKMVVVIRMQESPVGVTRVALSATVSTRPFFMVFLMKGLLRAKLQDMLIGLKYYLETGQAVTKEAFPEIHRQYRSLRRGDQQQAGAFPNGIVR